jgi:hypothetical protein
MEINQPNSLQPKMRGRKLRSGVNLEVALKKKGVKQKGVIVMFCNVK